MRAIANAAFAAAALPEKRRLSVVSAPSACSFEPPKRATSASSDRRSASRRSHSPPKSSGATRAQAFLYSPARARASQSLVPAAGAAARPSGGDAGFERGSSAAGSRALGSGERGGSASSDFGSGSARAATAPRAISKRPSWHEEVSTSPARSARASPSAQPETTTEPWRRSRRSQSFSGLKRTENSVPVTRTVYGPALKRH